VQAHQSVNPLIENFGGRESGKTFIESAQTLVQCQPIGRKWREQRLEGKGGRGRGGKAGGRQKTNADPSICGDGVHKWIGGHEGRKHRELNINYIKKCGRNNISEL
jgi:hypothetical protein